MDGWRLKGGRQGCVASNFSKSSSVRDPVFDGESRSSVQGRVRARHEEETGRRRRVGSSQDCP